MATLGKNYYEILELNKECSNEDIFVAYKRLSLKFHPKSNSSKDFAVNNYQFHQISEAFIVLSNSKLRGIYDVYGKDGLINGVLDNAGNILGGFKYTGNAFQVFEKFFGTVNPFALIRDGFLIDSEWGSMFNTSLAEEKLKDLEIDYFLTLEEIFEGGVKKVNFKKIAINEDKRTTFIKNCSVEIEVHPGVPENSVISFPRLGNEMPGRTASNLIITIKSLPHQKFKRNGADLLYTYDIRLPDALKSSSLVITSLNKTRLDITMDEIIKPQTVKKVAGEGLPIYDNSKLLSTSNSSKLKRGDLYIMFNIIFPTFIDQSAKEELEKLLEESFN